jgi:hypothetical protein
MQINKTLIALIAAAGFTSAAFAQTSAPAAPEGGEPAKAEVKKAPKAHPAKAPVKKHVAKKAAKPAEAAPATNAQ